jgi:hypothetical protein
MTNECASRARVVACAREWIDTPFHDMARVKGVGVDCVQLIAAAFEEAGLVEHVDTGRYSPQHFLHSDGEQFLTFLSRYAHEIDESEADTADIIAYRIGRAFSHAAIVVDWPLEIIHAHKLSGKVVAMRGDIADLQGRPRRFFSVWR